MKALVKAASRARLRLLASLSSRKDFTCCACASPVPGFYQYGSSHSWGCPRCDSSPRERFVNYAIDTGLLALAPGAKVLQIAPSERSLVKRFKAQGELFPADIEPARFADLSAIKLDLLDMPRIGSFDLIYASHVLEHVSDDERALRTMFAHLNPGGEAWLIVPLAPGPTVDGTPETSALERERRFGQWDHYRQYGRDFEARIAAAGFLVRKITALQIDERERNRLGLDAGEIIFVGKNLGHTDTHRP